MNAKNEFMWAHLIHLGTNMWNEEGNTKGREHRSNKCASPVLLFNRPLWDAHIEKLRAAGVNTLVIDVGDALRYESHPEIALEGSWTHGEMRKEIEKLRAMGFSLVPKVNFSACHDIWLKEYSRMLSTPVYYQVCKDIIEEICAVFKPEYLHIGMDEERYEYQQNFDYAVVRHGELWWKDFYFLVNEVEKHNTRAWIWSDYVWHNPEIFLKKMPKSVLQSNWYYSSDFSDSSSPRLAAFELLDKHGFDQVPTGSVWADKDNFEKLTGFVLNNVSDSHLLGMLQTSWERIDDGWMHIHDEAARHIILAKNVYQSIKG